MNRPKEVARAIGVGLLACPGGIALLGGYSASGGMHGWSEFLIRAPRQAFRGDALLFWLGAIAVSFLCVALLRAGIVGVAGIAIAMAGSSVALLSTLALGRGEGGELFLLVLGLAVWALGVAIMSWARNAAVAKRESSAAEQAGQAP